MKTKNIDIYIYYSLFDRLQYECFYKAKIYSSFHAHCSINYYKQYLLCFIL